MCAALQVTLDNGQHLLVTDADDTLAWDREGHHGWDVGPYPSDDAHDSGHLAYGNTPDSDTPALLDLVREADERLYVEDPRHRLTSSITTASRRTYENNDNNHGRGGLMIDSGPVHLRIIEVNISNISHDGNLVLDVQAPSVEAFEQATAWAEVRGYTRLSQALEWFFTNKAPVDGYAALINKPHSLKIVVTWPWAPARLPPGY